MRKRRARSKFLPARVFGVNSFNFLAIYMKHGFLLMTHFPPEMLSKQIKRMQSEDHYFFIHYDKKINIDENDPYYLELKAQKNVIFAEQRHLVNWGSIGGVNAILELLKAAMKYKDIGYLHVFSGLCLPVKPLDYIHEYFRKNNGKQFIDHGIMPEYSKEHSFTKQRVDKYHLHLYYDPRSPKIKDVTLKYVNSAFRKLQRGLKLIGIYRRYPSRFPTLYAGKTWWSMTFDACAYIMDFVDKNPDFLHFFKYVQLADEVFFQTIIMSSPFTANVVNDNVRFQDFTNAVGYANTLTMEHAEGLKGENVLFARKFDKQSKELVEWLDKNVL